MIEYEKRQILTRIYVINEFLESRDPNDDGVVKELYESEKAKTGKQTRNRNRGSDMGNSINSTDKVIYFLSSAF